MEDLGSSWSVMFYNFTYSKVNDAQVVLINLNSLEIHYFHSSMEEDKKWSEQKHSMNSFGIDFILTWSKQNSSHNTSTLLDLHPLALV